MAKTNANRLDPVMSHTQPFSVLGAYALVARLVPELRQEAYGCIPSLGVDALEIPMAEFLAGAERATGVEGTFGSPASALSGEFSPLDLALNTVVTCIPSVMGRLGVDPSYGLASLQNESAHCRCGRCAQGDQAGSGNLRQGWVGCCPCYPHPLRATVR